jgi:DNA-binding transcriptional LysR family regulator
MTRTRLARHLTLRQLEILDAIARTGSFGRAADALFVSQPTVSIQIKKLSETLGAPLLEKVDRQLVLTDIGEALLETGREVFDAFERLDMRIAALSDVKTGMLRLGLVTTADYFLPRLLEPFCTRYPGVDVRLEVTNRERLLGRLLDNLDDLYVFGQNPESSHVVQYPLEQNPLVVIAATDHRLAGRKEVPLEELMKEPFISREPGSGTRRTLAEHFGRYDFTPRIHMELASTEAIKQAVAGGLGISVLSQHTLEGEERRLAVLSVQRFPIQRMWYIAHRKGKQLNVVAQAFLNHCRQFRVHRVGGPVRRVG